MAQMCYEFREALHSYGISSLTAETDRNESDVWRHIAQLTYNFVLAKNEALITFEFIVPGTDKVIKVQQVVYDLSKESPYDI